jgi:CubicO group peptidase (beta-lactamase class C family)
MGPTYFKTVCITVMAAALTPFLTAHAKTPPPCVMEYRNAQLIDRIEQQLVKNGAPGLAVAVVRNNCVLVAKGFGFRNLERHKPVTAHTLFPAGSNSKGLTAIAIGRLVSEGRLEFTTSVRRLLPSFGLADPTHAQSLTVRDLLSHRSGVGAHNLLWYGSPPPTATVLIERMHYLEPVAPPGEKFIYNNLMYAVAGEVTASAAGKPWSDYVRQELMEPLGMTSATLSHRAFLRAPDHATPYLSDDGLFRAIPVRDLGGMAAAGGMSASANDMALWLMFLLSGRNLEGKLLLSPDILGELWTSLGARGSRSIEAGASDPHYGMGFNIDYYHGHRRVHHTGSIDGFHSRMLIFPSDNLAIYAVTNVEGGRLPEIVGNDIADQLLGLSQTDWATVFAIPSATPPLRASPETAQEANRLVGDYTHRAYGCLRIKRDGRNSWMIYRGMRARLMRNGTIWLAKPEQFNAQLLEGITVSRSGDHRLTVKMDPSSQGMIFSREQGCKRL